MRKSCKVLDEGQVVWEQLPHVHVLQDLDGANHFSRDGSDAPSNLVSWLHLVLSPLLP